MPAMCVRIRTQKRSERFQVCVKMCAISICTTHVKLGSSARLHVARSPNPRAEPTQGASTALSVCLYRSASRTTHHTLCTAHYTSTCSLSLFDSLSCRISPPSAHAPLSNTRTHTTHAHAETLIVPHSLLTPPLPSPLYPRADHSSSADGARCGAIGCGCTGTLGCGLVAACIALSCIAIAVTFST